MSISLRLLASLTAAAALSSVLAAQQAAPPQSPARDAIIKPSVGTATIVGTVVTDEATPRPIRRATVSLTASGAFGPSALRMATTDDAGRFAFTRLPAGNYVAPRVSKAGFVAAAYGEKRPMGIGTPITLTEGQRLTIAMKMLRGGVITGTICDELNRPMSAVSVTVSMVRTVNGQRTTGGAFGNSNSTDDRGVYRVFGLAPGDYIVSVSPRLSINTELRPVTDAEIKWAQQQVHPAGAAMPGSAPAAAPKPAQAVTYTMVYYPGTADPSAASTVTVVSGQERSGVDFSASLVPTARVSGSIVDANGQPSLNAQVNLVPKFDPNVVGDSFYFLDSVMLNRPTVTNGSFSMVGVKPGEYTLTARAAPRASGGGAPASGRGSAAPMSLWATEDISVNGADITGVALRLQAGMTLSGRVAFDGSTLQPPTDLSRVSVRLTSAPSPTGVTVTIGGSTSPVAPDGTFKFDGMTPGRYFVSASAPGVAPGPSTGAMWTVRSAVAGSVDAADTPVEIKPDQDISGVVLTFTDKQAELSGTLFDAAGHSTSDFSIILFPTDRTFWSQRSRRIRPPVRTSTEGKFKMANLLPGEYYLAALSDFEPSDYYNPAFLEQVAATAMKVTIAEGEKKVQDVKLAGGS